MNTEKEKFEVLLEEQRSNFKLLAEGISLLNNKSDRIEGKINEVDSYLQSRKVH